MSALAHLSLGVGLLSFAETPCGLRLRWIRGHFGPRSRFFLSSAFRRAPRCSGACLHEGSEAEFATALKCKSTKPAGHHIPRFGESYLASLWGM